MCRASPALALLPASGYYLLLLSFDAKGSPGEVSTVRRRDLRLLLLLRLTTILVPKLCHQLVPVP